MWTSHTISETFGSFQFLKIDLEKILYRHFCYNAEKWGFFRCKKLNMSTFRWIFGQKIIFSQKSSNLLGNVWGLSKVLFSMFWGLWDHINEQKFSSLIGVVSVYKLQKRKNFSRRILGQKIHFPKNCPSYCG